MPTRILLSPKSEAIAFMNDSPSPWWKHSTGYDLDDTLTIDTIIEKKYTHFLPDDILLKAFKEDFYSQYLIKRNVWHRKIHLIF